MTYTKQIDACKNVDDLIYENGELRVVALKIEQGGRIEAYLLKLRLDEVSDGLKDWRSAQQRSTPLTLLKYDIEKAATAQHALHIAAALLDSYDAGGAELLGKAIKGFHRKAIDLNNGGALEEACYRKAVMQMTDAFDFLTWTK